MSTSPSSMLNWEGSTEICSAASLFVPETERELIEFLQDHPADKLRVVGSRYSNTALLKSPGAWTISLEKLTGIVRSTENTVTVRGGSRLADVYSDLYARGYMIVCAPGVISQQTVAGAISTGTHGQGMDQCSLADTITKLRMVRVDGSVVDIEDDDDLIGAYRVNLGCLGVLTEVTLRIRPAAEFTCWKRTVSSETLRREFQKWNATFEYAKAWWFVDEDQAHVWLSHQTDRIDDHVRAVMNEIEASDRDFEATIDAKIAHLKEDTKTEDTSAKQFQTVQRFKDSATLNSDLYNIWCKGIPVRQINTEIAVPMGSFDEAMDRLMAMMKRTHVRTHYPIILRCTGASDAWLSPTGGEPVCHFGFVVYYAADGTVSQEGAEYVRLAETELAPLKGRPHWGKYYNSELYDMPALYDKMEDFKKVCVQDDPERRLQNSHTETLLQYY